MYNLKKTLKSQYKTIKSAYRTQNGTQCFFDNYKQTVKYLKSALHVKTDVNLDYCTELCKKMCINGTLPDTDGIIDFLKDKKLNLSALMHLQQCVISALCAHIASKLASDDTPDEGIKSLLMLPDINFPAIISALSDADKILSSEPCNIYNIMSEHTKNMYRKSICNIASKNTISESKAATDLLVKATTNNKHIGFFMELNGKKSAVKETIAEAVLPVAITAIICKKVHNFSLFVPLLLPVCEISRAVTDKLLIETQKHTKLPSMDFEKGIPQDRKAVITICTIVPNIQQIGELKSHLKKIYLANKAENAPICLLADLKNSPVKFTQDDEQKIEMLKNTLHQLKNETGGNFILAVREREYSASQGEFAPFERKRGAIIELVKFIKTGKNTFKTLLGDTEKLNDAKYLMLLDIDTQLPPDMLKKLVEIASHPLNEPQIDTEKRVTKSGYGIIMPAVKTSIESYNSTYFTNLFSDGCSIGAYSPEIKEKNMILTGTSVFCGKGLINIDAFYQLIVNRFPANYVLSHDILEGEILRTAFADSVELTDSFPADTNAYLKRLNRWVRGDTQNIVFAFDNKMNLSAESKRRLLENFRRCITPVFAVAGMLYARLLQKKYARIITAVCGFSFISADAFSALFAFLKNPENNLLRHYFSFVLPYCLACLVRGMFSAVFSIKTAFTCADGIIKSLYRMLVSKQKLLEWVPAADCNNSSLLSQVKKSIPSYIFAAILPKHEIIIRKLTLADLPLSVLSARRINKTKKRMMPEMLCELTVYCRDMWQFVLDFSTEEFNYLIPDNIIPKKFTDCRTSPTNIGLMLCCILAARDFGFIGSDVLFTMLNNTFSSIEKLPKYNGNLYNWYDIKTLKVIEPEFVSSVDSGNFMCCLTALKEGLKEYLQESSDLQLIINKCESMITECNFDFMFNKNRNLISVGYDVKNCELSQCHYDLLMSESRMMSFFAVAKRKIPLKHWQSLGRQRNRYGLRCAASAWSGTMFEYFMPALFLPAQPSTLAYESLMYCIHCQKKYAEKFGVPYGISESAYNAVDSDGNYQYKAHGVKKASRRPDTFNELVISPYSSFLTLQYDIKSAADNLKKLKNYDMYGKYGFYESCDFEPCRNELTAYSTIKTYMSHHIGMSFLGAANCIFDGIMQKRFMADQDMAGFASLLSESPYSDTAN